MAGEKTLLVILRFVKYRRKYGTTECTEKFSVISERISFKC